MGRRREDEDLGVIVDSAHEGGVEDQDHQQPLVAVEVANLRSVEETLILSKVFERFHDYICSTELY